MTNSGHSLRVTGWCSRRQEETVCCCTMGWVSNAVISHNAMCDAIDYLLQLVLLTSHLRSIFILELFLLPIYKLRLIIRYIRTLAASLMISAALVRTVTPPASHSSSFSALSSSSSSSQPSSPASGRGKSCR